MNISYNGYCFADIEVKRIRGSRRIGAYRLWLHVDVSMHAWKDTKLRLTEIRGETHIRFPGNVDRLLGTLWPEIPVNMQTSNSPHNSNFGLFLDMDYRCLEEIEKLRDGGDLYFRLCFMGVADGPNGLWPINEWLQPEFHANQSTWLKVLEEMDYQHSFVYEIAIQKNEESDPIGQSVTYLHQAHQDFMGGRYEDAIGDCRKALERLAERLQDQPQIDAATKQYCRIKEFEQTIDPSSLSVKGDSRKAMSADERFLLLRAAVQHISNLAHHATDHPSGYRRSDAKCVITITTALIGRFRENL